MPSFLSHLWSQLNENFIHARLENRFPLFVRQSHELVVSTLQGAGGIGGLLARSDKEKVVPAILSPQNPNPQNVINSYYFNDANGNVTALVSPNGLLCEIMSMIRMEIRNLSMSGLLASQNQVSFLQQGMGMIMRGYYYYLDRFYDRIYSVG